MRRPLLGSVAGSPSPLRLGCAGLCRARVYFVGSAPVDGMGLLARLATRRLAAGSSVANACQLGRQRSGGTVLARVGVCAAVYHAFRGRLRATRGRKLTRCAAHRATRRGRVANECLLVSRCVPPLNSGATDLLPDPTGARRRTLLPRGAAGAVGGWTAAHAALAGHPHELGRGGGGPTLHAGSRARLSRPLLRVGRWTNVLVLRARVVVAHPLSARRRAVPTQYGHVLSLGARTHGLGLGSRRGTLFDEWLSRPRARSGVGGKPKGAPS